MSNHFSEALWLVLNLEVKNDFLDIIFLRDLHDACDQFFLKNIGISAPNRDVISKLIKRLFDVPPSETSSKFSPSGEYSKTTIFRNIRNRVGCSSNTVQLPTFCKVLATEPVFIFSCLLPVVIDGVQQTCTVGFETNDLWIRIKRVKLSAGFQVPITNSNIEGIIHFITSIKLCTGATKDEGYVPKTFKEERIATIFETGDRVVMRSKHCHVIMEWLSSSDMCSSCNILRIRKSKNRKRKHSDEIEKSTDHNKLIKKSDVNSKQIPVKVSVTAAEDKGNNNPCTPVKTTAFKATDLKDVICLRKMATDPLPEMGISNMEIENTSDIDCVTSSQQDLAVQENASSSLNVAELITFRNNIFKVVEELRVKREVDFENEEKMKQLVNEKHANIAKTEELLAKIQGSEEEKKVECESIKKKYEARIKVLVEEKAKSCNLVGTLNKEIRSLKDEIRELQIGKYTIEKRLSEQDRKMSLHTDSRISAATQMAEIEEACKTIRKDMADLGKKNEDIEKNVDIAVKTNKKITFMNKHQNCEITDYVNQIKTLQEQLVDAKVKLDAKPTDHNQELFEKQQTILKLQQDNQLKEQLLTNLKEKLLHQKEDNEKNQTLLKDSYHLVQRQVDSISRYQSEIKLLMSQLSESTSKVQKLETNLGEVEKQLCIEKEVFKKGLDTWKEQEERLQSQLKTLQEDYEAINKSYSDLDDLNNKWASENMNLKQQHQALQEKLNKPTTEVGVQKSVAEKTTAIQASVFNSSIYTQTPMSLLSVSTQTECAETLKTPWNFLKVIDGSPQKRKYCSTVTKAETINLSPHKPSSQPLPLTKENLSIETFESNSEPLPEEYSAPKKRNLQDSIRIAEKKKENNTQSPIKKKKLDLAPKKCQSPEKRYVLKFLDQPSNTPTENPKSTANEKTSRLRMTKKIDDAEEKKNHNELASILTDPGKIKKKVNKRVTFAIEDTMSKPCEVNSTVSKSATSHDNNAEESLFSDDEAEKIEIATQVSRIETFLKSD